MTELALILGIQVAALAYAWVVGRPSVALRGLPQRLARLDSALERAAAVLALLQTRVLLLGAGLLGLVLVVLHAVGVGGAERLPRAAAALTAAFGFVLGVGTTWLATRIAQRLGLQAATRVPAAANRGLDSALSLAMRSGIASGLAIEAATTLGLIFAFGAAFALLGGTALPARDAYTLALLVAQALATFPLGSALTALVLQRSGTTFQTAAELGGSVSADSKFGLSREDPRSPSIVGELTGEQVGAAGTRAALGCTTSAIGQLALLVLGLCAARLDPTPQTHLLLLPFVLRAFFTLASAFGSAAVRTEEMTSPSAGILRGYASMLVVGLTGIAGACLWLGRDHFTALCAAGVVGALTAAGSNVWAWTRLLRRGRSVKEAAELLRSGGGSLPMLGLGEGMQAALAPIVVLGVGTAACWQLGASTGLPSGGVWGLLVGWACLLGSAPFASAIAALGSATRGARGVSAMGKLDADVLRRTLRIEETLPAVSAARSHLISSSSGAAVLAAMAIPALASGQQLRIQVGLLDPTVVWSGAIGAVLVLAYAGACVRAAVRAGRNVALEVDRQLRRFPKESGTVQLPSDFSPSYRACVDSASRGAFEQLISHLGLVFLVPSSLALLLRVWYRGSEGARAAEGLMSFVLLSSIVGLAAALALDFSRATLSAARRAARSADSSEAVFVAGADGTGEVLAFSAAPATQVSIALFAALALAAAPFMN